MHLKIALLLITVCFFIAACGENLSRLPFPTPAQHDLVVLTSPGPLTYNADKNATPTGLEHDLVEAFAQELGVAVEYIVVPPEELASRLETERYHLAASWLSPNEHLGIQATPAIFQTRDILVQHEASLPLTELAQLGGKTVHVMKGSRQAVNLQILAREIPGLKIVEISLGNILDLLELLANRKVELVVIDANLDDIATQLTPTLRTSLTLGEEQAIVWQLGRRPNTELAARANAFIERVQHDGTLARLEDRYFGHARRLKQNDVIKFLVQIEETLPKLRRFFETAERVTGIDWRLIAAVAYHESHWDANATSYTNVRGIMMLTEETADRLGVSNRLDARESILAGARYINLLKDLQADDVSEPDRTWLALAAYNIGPGHFNAARMIARQLNADSTSWYEMKRILPLLAMPKYYERLKSGRARGGEAVILVENIRSYYDILVRNAPALQASASPVDKAVAKPGTGPGLKLKR